MKIFKRIVSAVLSAALMTTTFASCNVFKKLSMAEMLSEMNQIKSGDIKMSADIQAEENNMKLSFAGSYSNNNISYDDMSFKFNPEDEDAYSQPIDFSGKDFMKYVDKNIYINVQSIIDLVMEAVSNDVFQINADKLGIKWLKVPMDLGIESNTEQSKEFSNTNINSFQDILKSSDVKIEEDGDNGYKVSISDNAQFAKIVGETAKKLKADKDTYISQYKSTMKSFDYKKILDSSIDAVIDAVKSLCDKLDIKYTDEDLKQIKEQATSSIPSEELNITDENIKEIESKYDDFVSKLEDMQKDIADSKDEVNFTYTVSLEGKEGSRIAKQSINFDGKNKDGEKFSIKFNYEFKEGDVNVEAPKDSKTIGECTGNVIDFLVESGYISEEDLKQFEGKNLADLLSNMNQETNFDSDYDYNDVSLDDYDFSDYDFDDSEDESVLSA